MANMTAEQRAEYDEWWPKDQREQWPGYDVEEGFLAGWNSREQKMLTVQIKAKVDAVTHVLRGLVLQHFADITLFDSQKWLERRLKDHDPDHGVQLYEGHELREYLKKHS